MIPVEHYLAFSLLLFAIGASGALVRRNPVIILMSIELMLIAVNVNLVAFSRTWGKVHGQLFSIFIMADAAAETALALGILVSFAARLQIPELRKGASTESTTDDETAQLFASDDEMADIPVERPVR